MLQRFKALFPGILVAAAAITILFAGQAHVQASADPAVQQRKAVSGKIREMPQADLRKLIAREFYNDESAQSVEDVAMDYVVVDDVTVAGNVYTLIFVGGHDMRGWKLSRPYLPEQVAKAPAKAVPTDEETLKYVQALTQVAEKNFNTAALDFFDKNKDKFEAVFPDRWTDEQVRINAMAQYETEGNLEIAPGPQRLYNEYIALNTLADALEFYIKIKQKL